MSTNYSLPFRVKLTQHPVGKGGMMSGVIHSPRIERQFQWVYDCGAKKKKNLLPGIEDIARQGDIDCLFISHLDSDHINGIDELLLNTRVHEVVLPYLNKVDQLIAISHEVSAGTLSVSFLSFLNNIDEWFSLRGVERITYISPGSDNNQIIGIPLPEDPDGNGDGERFTQRN